MKKIIFLTLLSFLLTGCIQWKTTINLETPSITSTLLIKEDVMNSYHITPESLKKQLIANSYLFKNFKIIPVKKTINNDKYQGIKIIAPPSYISTLKQHLIKTNQKDKCTYTFSYNCKDLPIDFSELNLDSQKTNLLKLNSSALTVNIKMPGTINSTSIGTIKGNTVEIELLDYLNNQSLPDIKIISSTQEKKVSSIYLLIPVILIIILIISHYAKKHKKDI